MKRSKIKVIVSAALLTLLWVGLRPAAANDLEGVGITRLGDSIAVTITTSSECDYTAFLTESKPERIVVDLAGVVNNLSKKQFSGLPLKSLKSIRTSQFKSEPDPQARVVLDINRPVEFKSSKAGIDVIIKFAAVPAELASVNWNSNAEYASEPASIPVVEKSKPVVQAPPPVVEKITPPIPKPIEKPVEIAKVPTPAPIEKQAVTAVELPQAAPTPVEKPMAAAQKPVDKIPAEPVAEDVSADEPLQAAITTPATGPQGIEVDTTPKRKTIEYTANDEKDPFSPLVGLGKGNPKQGLPSLENLKLVGVLEDNNEISSALLEDGEGNGYILKPNDRIQSGYLITVTDTKAVFEVTEYGWTRTVALELQVPVIK